MTGPPAASQTADRHTLARPMPHEPLRPRRGPKGPPCMREGLPHNACVSRTRCGSPPCAQGYRQPSNFFRKRPVLRIAQANRAFSAGMPGRGVPADALCGVPCAPDADGAGPGGSTSRTVPPLRAGRLPPPFSRRRGAGSRTTFRPLFRPDTRQNVQKRQKTF